MAPRSGLLPAGRGWAPPGRGDSSTTRLSRGPPGRLLVWLVPVVLLVASRSAFSDWMSWSYLLATLGSMALFALAVGLLTRREDGFALHAAVGGALLVKTLLLGLVTVTRGPLGYWYRFWTDEQSSCTSRWPSQRSSGCSS